MTVPPGGPRRRAAFEKAVAATPDPVPPEPVKPVDPKSNKAVVAAVGTLVTVGLRWLISGHFGLGDEGVVGLAGAITTTLVYCVSNWRRLRIVPRG